MNIKKEVFQVCNNKNENKQIIYNIKQQLKNEFDKNNIDISFNLEINIENPYLIIKIYPYLHKELTKFSLNPFFFEIMNSIGYYNFDYNLYDNYKVYFSFEYDLNNLND